MHKSFSHRLGQLQCCVSQPCPARIYACTNLCTRVTTIQTHPVADRFGRGDRGPGCRRHLLRVSGRLLCRLRSLLHGGRSRGIFLCSGHARMDMSIPMHGWCGEGNMHKIRVIRRCVYAGRGMSVLQT